MMTVLLVLGITTVSSLASMKHSDLILASKFHHLFTLNVDKHHVLGLASADRLHDVLGVLVGWEGHVLDTHLYLGHHPLLKLEPLGPIEDLMTDGAGHAVAGHDNHVCLVTVQQLKDLEAEADVKIDMFRSTNGAAQGEHRDEDLAALVDADGPVISHYLHQWML